MKKCYVGIDTSNYTTSAAFCDEEGRVIANLKIPLPVKEGNRGLRQSDAVFEHVRNLPAIMNSLKNEMADYEAVAVGVSTTPRDAEGSYMPCFLSGIAARDSILAVTSARGYSFSHQCGHIMAALYGSESMDLLTEEFVAFHISGGTTEMLKVKGNGIAFDAELIGGTADLNAGQVIDRVGVHMGLSFPAGREMEELALKNDKKIPKSKPKIKGLEFNLSGLENLSEKLYETEHDARLTAAFTFDYIAAALISVCEAYEADNGKTKFVFAGGVMSNSIIKNRLAERFNAVFAEPTLSSDNAVGIAALTRQAYITEK